MKLAVAVPLLVSVICVTPWTANAAPKKPPAVTAGSPAMAAPAHPKGKAHSIPTKAAPAQANTPLTPAKAASLQAKASVWPAKKKGSMRSYWLASRPHVPLATIDGEVIRPIGKRGESCGAASRWAKPKSRWKAVDAWGQVTGAFTIEESELYEVTQCHEVSFKGRAHGAPASLFVSEDSAWRPVPSVEWKPGGGDLKHYEQFLGELEETWVNEKPAEKQAPLAKRTLFFKMPGADPSSSEKRSTQWAVTGGRLLVVAYLGERGKWKASEVKAPLGRPDSYQPIAVFDMNGDGLPEIVYSDSDGPSYGDSVLSVQFGPGSAIWKDAAASPGGATI